MSITPDHGRIIVCADDFGADVGSDEVIRALLDQGDLGATTCLVGGPGWSQGAAFLRDRPAGKASVGLHLNLTQSWAEEAGPAVAPIRVHVARAFLPRDRALEAAIADAFVQQWEGFTDAVGRAPDFMDGHEHVHLFPAARAALFRLCEQRGFNGWLRQCRTSSHRFSVKRLVLDPFSEQFARDARRLGLAVNAGFGGLRRFDPAEDVGALWRTDLAGMKDGGVLMVHPGESDGTHAGDCRAQEAGLLASGWTARTLAEPGRTKAP